MHARHIGYIYKGHKILRRFILVHRPPIRKEVKQGHKLDFFLSSLKGLEFIHLLEDILGFHSCKDCHVLGMSARLLKIHFVLFHALHRIVHLSLLSPFVLVLCISLRREKLLPALLKQRCMRDSVQAAIGKENAFRPQWLYTPLKMEFPGVVVVLFLPLGLGLLITFRVTAVDVIVSDVVDVIITAGFVVASARERTQQWNGSIA
jgi:hypothetical protein